MLTEDDQRILAANISNAKTLLELQKHVNTHYADLNATHISAVFSRLSKFYKETPFQGYNEARFDSQGSFLGCIINKALEIFDQLSDKNRAIICNALTKIPTQSQRFQHRVIFHFHVHDLDPNLEPQEIAMLVHALSKIYSKNELWLIVMKKLFASIMERSLERFSLREISMIAYSLNNIITRDAWWLETMLKIAAIVPDFELNTFGPHESALLILSFSTVNMVAPQCTVNTIDNPWSTAMLTLVDAVKNIGLDHYQDRQLGILQRAFSNLNSQDPRWSGLVQSLQNEVHRRAQEKAAQEMEAQSGVSAPNPNFLPQYQHSTLNPSATPFTPIVDEPGLATNNSNGEYKY